MPRGDPRTSESGDRENVWRGAHRGPDRRPVEGHPRPGDATAEAEPGRGLRESGERFRLLAEHTGDLVIRHAPDTTVLYASPLAETITGWRAEELVGRRTLELVHPDDVPLLARAVEEMAEQREPGRLRLRVREPSGAYRWLESMFRPVRDERDRVVEVVSSTRDVREQVAAEEALRESEERYRLLAENSTDAIVRVGLDGRLRYASPALEEILGRPVESHDREGGAFVNVHPDDRPALGAWFRRIVRGDTGLPSLRCRVRGGDRGWFWIEMLGRLVRTADGVPSEVQGSVRDVTRQVEAEEALRESEARYRLLAGNSTDAIIRADLEGRVLDQTSAFEEILGRPMGPRLGFENIHPDDRDLVLARFTANATGEIERDTLRFRERHADGHYVWMEIRSRLVRDEHGAPREVQFSARDVSAQVEAEVALRESEARFRMVAENASDMIARQDPSGRFLWVSPASTRILGYTPEELVGRLPDMFVAPEDRSRLVLAGGHPPTPGMTRQVRVRHKSGRTVWIEITYNPLFDDDGALVEAYTTVRDVTGLRQLDDERALRRVATAVAEGRPSAEVFALVADEARALLEGDTGAVMRWDGGETYEVVGTAGAIGPALGLRPPVAGSSSSAQVIRTGRPMRVDDYGVVDADTVAVFGAAAGIGCTLTAPIRAGGRIWGTVGVGSMLPGAFGSEAERRLARFAELVGPAVVNAAQRESLQSLAATDPLTGLANHRTFHERLAEEVARAARHGRPLAVAMLDLDHFKEINDALGHHAGDEVLAEVARRLAGAARPGDTVARVGGEEFAWIFPDCDAAGAERACERARAAVARDPAGGQGVRVTLSAGVCDLHTARRAEALPQLADGALYWAKSTGRDRVVVYSPGVVRELSVVERVSRLERSRTLVALRALARAVDAKDHHTLQHSERVAELAARVARRLGWDGPRVELLREAALLHDVGKIGVPDSALFAPGTLTRRQWEQIHQHAALGASIVEGALAADQVAWIRGHHERWGGGGYPDGLEGEAIPEGARILALADAWDAMVTARHYRAALDRHGALRQLAECSGGQFWPAGATALAELVEEWGGVHPPGSAA